MKKKIFAVALAATMTISSAFTAFAETITGAAWWDASNETSSEYELAGDGSLTLDIATDSADEGVAFCVEVWQGDTSGYYFTTTSAGDAWFFTATGDVTKDASYAVTAGDTVEVTVTRSGNTFTVSYLDKTTGSAVCPDVVGVGAEDWGDAVQVHVLAQVGTIEVSQADSAADTTEEVTTTAAAADTTDTTEEATTTAAAEAVEATTTTGTTTNATTGDVAPYAVAVLALAAVGAVVALQKKKVTE